ncbi:hypothetical protein TNCV_552431 [Trichonephila clavipes]|nr:hypothetical protein TNCV_552431 [Trichonephila clavipes]
MWVRLGSTDLMAGVMFLLNQGDRLDSNESDSFRSDLVGFKSWSTATILGTFTPSLGLPEKTSTVRKRTLLPGGNRDYRNVGASRFNGPYGRQGYVLAPNQGDRLDGNAIRSGFFSK